MKKKILVAIASFGEFDREAVRLLEENDCEYVLNTRKRRLNKEEILEMGQGCAGIIAGLEVYDEPTLEKLTGLRVISRVGTGVDNIPLKKAQELGIVIKNTPEASVTAVAELTVAMMLDLLKKLSLHNDLMKKKVWERHIGNLLAGKKVGVLGLGRIGRRVAELLVPFRAEVYGAEIFPDNAWLKKTGVRLISTDKLLKTCDILTIHVSAVAGREFVLDREAISGMKKGAFLVNLSRGRVIDEAALYDALKSEHLAGAALDVFSTEPYAGPLCELGNVILTPHIATFTRESRIQMEIEAVKNLLDVLKF